MAFCESYATFTVKVPVGKPRVTPVYGSNSLFDEFIISLTSALGAEIWKHKKCEIDEAFTLGPYRQLTRPIIDRGIDNLVEDIAAELVSGFAEKLKRKLPAIDGVGTIMPPPSKSDDDDSGIGGSEDSEDSTSVVPPGDDGDEDKGTKGKKTKGKKTKGKKTKGKDTKGKGGKGKGGNNSGGDKTPVGEPIGEPIVDPPPPEVDGEDGDAGSVAPPPDCPGKDEVIEHLKDWGNTHLRELADATSEKTLAAAATKIQALAGKYKIPSDEVKKAANLAYYDFLILYDDSGSMGAENRIATTKSTIKGLFTAARAIDDKTTFAVRSFTGPQWGNVASHSVMQEVLDAMVFNTGESLPGPMRDRLVNPLLRQASTRTLKPTICVMITDGDIGGIEAFSASVTDFKGTLDASGYAGPVVLLLVCRVGTDASAEQSLLQLQTTPEISKWLYYNEDSLDNRLQLMTEDAFVGTVIVDLVRAMELQEFPPEEIAVRAAANN